MLFRPAAILLVAGICAMRATAADYYSVDLFSGLVFNGTQEHHLVYIGEKYYWDKLACGSCKDITKIPAGHLHSWIMRASRKVNLRFYGKKDCKDELKPTFTAKAEFVMPVTGDILYARSFKGCAV
ncbi:hypothetical protein BV22DRAFT_1134564 [Leucogyrophana mollusca]|uniref:Uncharacterized protein n=1 Tax=Leucogyrophana mollusca TaxID=85980 RepID=A0ACB8AY56_9AGAM|nr:hypothetical protein BV22DRAFT_1134564 [Leucogyrophana mollusca]